MMRGVFAQLYIDKNKNKNDRTDAWCSCSVYYASTFVSLSFVITRHWRVHFICSFGVCFASHSRFGFPFYSIINKRNNSSISYIRICTILVYQWPVEDGLFFFRISSYVWFVWCAVYCSAMWRWVGRGRTQLRNNIFVCRCAHCVATTPNAHRTHSSLTNICLSILSAECVCVFLAKMCVEREWIVQVCLPYFFSARPQSHSRSLSLFRRT